MSGPLTHKTEKEIHTLLRGFPDAAIETAVHLRTSADYADIEIFLYHLLGFYLPPGAKSPPLPEFSSETLLREDMGLDSLSLAECMYKLEELFDIIIDTPVIAEAQTIGDARDILLGKKLKPSEPSRGEASE